MVKHIVMWSVKDGANGMSKKQIAAEMAKKLLALKPIIKEIRTIEVSARGFDLSMRVSSRVFSGSKLDLGTIQ